MTADPCRSQRYPGLMWLTGPNSLQFDFHLPVRNARLQNDLFGTLCGVFWTPWEFRCCFKFVYTQNKVDTWALYSGRPSSLVFGLAFVPEQNYNVCTSAPECELVVSATCFRSCDCNLYTVSFGPMLMGVFINMVLYGVCSTKCVEDSPLTLHSRSYSFRLVCLEPKESILICGFQIYHYHLNFKKSVTSLSQSKISHND